MCIVIRGQVGIRKKVRTLSFAMRVANSKHTFRGHPLPLFDRRLDGGMHTPCVHAAVEEFTSIGAELHEKGVLPVCFSCRCGRPCARGGARPRSTCARRRSWSGLPWSMRHRSRLARRSAGRSALATKNVGLRSALTRKWLLLLSDHTGEKFELLGVRRLIDLVSRRTIDHLSVSFTESNVLTWSLFST